MPFSLVVSHFQRASQARLNLELMVSKTPLFKSLVVKNQILSSGQDEECDSQTRRFVNSQTRRLADSQTRYPRAIPRTLPSTYCYDVAIFVPPAAAVAD